jgi:hypothetical protein
MQMAPNLVGAGNQQSSARNNNRPRSKVVRRTIRNQAAHYRYHHRPAFTEHAHSRRQHCIRIFPTGHRHSYNCLAQPLSWIPRAARHSPRLFAGRRTGSTKRTVTAQHGCCCELGERCSAGCAQHAWAQGKDGKPILRRGQGRPVSWSRANARLRRLEGWN